MRNQIENALNELLYHLNQGDLLKAIDWKIKLNELLDQEISSKRKALSK